MRNPLNLAQQRDAVLVLFYAAMGRVGSRRGHRRGMLILAIFTYLAVRGGDRTARAAEHTASAAKRTLDLQTRPVLVPTRRDDPAQHVVFHSGHELKPDVAGGMAVLEDTGERIYLA